MKRPKFSIGFVMSTIAVIAVGLALLSRPTRLGVAIASSFAAISFTFATVAAIHLRGRSRSYWLGFAVGGWIYFVMPGVMYFREPRSHNQENIFFSHVILDVAYPYLVGEGPRMSFPPGSRDAAASIDSVPIPTPEHYHFAERWLEIDRQAAEGTHFLIGSTCYLLIGHCLFALLAAVGTGTFSQILHVRREVSSKPPDPEVRKSAS